MSMQPSGKLNRTELKGSQFSFTFRGRNLPKRKETRGYRKEENKLDTLLVTVQCNAIQCNENNIPLQRLCLLETDVALSYCLLVKDLNVDVLTLITW